MYEVAIRDDIRLWVLVQGKSQRSAARQFGVSRDTVARMLQEPAEKQKRRYERQQPKPAPVAETIKPYIEKWLATNAQLGPRGKKQRWTAHRMWVELYRLGIKVAESTVRKIVAQHRQIRKPAFVPLDFGPGERAEFDFGHAQVILAGKQVTLPFIAGRLRFSGAMYVEFLPTERQDSWLFGQRDAFEFWSGVPQYAVYDNTNTLVKEILTGHTRVEQERFRHFRSAYELEAIYANVASGWEKGSVENLVGAARRNYMVPFPEGPTIQALNETLRQQCLADRQRTMAGRNESIATLLAVEQQHLQALPEHPVEVGTIREVLVTSTSRIKFETNQYSVPTTYAYRSLTLKADPFQVCVYCGNERVADHPRSYGRNQVVEDWRHYIPLLLEKPAAVPFASCLKGGAIPPEWEAFRQQLAARRSDGNREFARVLELCLTHSTAEVGAAMELAAASASYSADAIRQLLQWSIENVPDLNPLDSTRYPAYHLPQPQPDLTAYNRLLGVKA